MVSIHYFSTVHNYSTISFPLKQNNNPVATEKLYLSIIYHFFSLDTVNIKECDLIFRIITLWFSESLLPLYNPVLQSETDDVSTCNKIAFKTF